MTKSQKICIEEELTNILRKITLNEDRLDTAEENGNEELAKVILNRLGGYRDYLIGADIVLTHLGFVREHHEEEDGTEYYTLEKI